LRATIRRQVELLILTDRVISKERRMVMEGSQDIMEVIQISIFRVNKLITEAEGLLVGLIHMLMINLNPTILKSKTLSS